LRRQHTFDTKVGLMRRDIESESQTDQPDPDHIEDDLLRLVFVACHPVLSPDARAAMTLRLIGGLTTDEIARAYLIPEPTVAKRIVRAKRTLSEAGVPFEVPAGADRSARLESVLEVVYLIYNEGYSATAGGDWMRPELCAEALRLGRMLAGLTPDEGEVHGMVALMEIQSSRTAARTGPRGEVIRLLDQDRRRWNQLLIRRGFAALERAAQCGPLGPYAIQAAIAAEHARARTTEATDWSRLAHLYAALATITPSPVVDLNRAVAVGMAEGPQAGLDIVDTLLENPLMRDYHLLPSVRGDLLEKLNRHDEARAEFQRAASLTRNAPERTLLLERAADNATGSGACR
jgi:predicted RNA polymerase sigma factor